MSFVFEDQTYVADEVLPVLRDAAHGFSRANDPDGRMNPESWGLAFAHAVAESDLRPALTDALRAMYAGNDEAELRLAFNIESALTALPAQELWNLLFAADPGALAEGGSDAARGGMIAASLLACMARGQTDVDPRAWLLLVRPDLAAAIRNPLLRIVGALEPARAASTVALFDAGDESDTLRRIQYAVSSLGSAALTTFVDTVAPALDKLGRPLGAESRAALAAMATARRNAGT